MKIVKCIKIKEKYQLTQFEDGTIHIDCLPIRTNPIELSKEEAVILKKFLTDSVLFGYQDGETRPIYLH